MIEKMALYLHLLIKTSNEVLHSLMGLKSSVTLACFTFIIFVNFLTCHQTPVEISPPLSLNEPHRQQTQDLLTGEENTTARLAENAQISGATTIAPQVTIAHPLGLVASNGSGADGDQAGDGAAGSSGFRHHETDSKILEDRIGHLTQSRHGGASTTTTRPSVTTVASMASDYDQEDDLRRIYLENSSSSFLDSEGTTTVASYVDPPANHVNTDRMLSQTATVNNSASSQDLQALETSRTMNLTHQGSINKTQRSVSINQSGTVHDDQPLIQASSTKTQKDLQDPLLDSQQPASPGSLIPNASLLDLLHIVKHLNLMSRGDESVPTNNMPPSDQLDSSNSTLIPIRQGARRDSDTTVREHNQWSQGAWNKRRTHSNQLISSPGAIQSMDFATNLAIATPEVLTTLESAALSNVNNKRAQMASNLHIVQRAPVGDSHLVANDNTRLNFKPASSASTKKPPKYSLISPYSADFDSGLEHLVKNALNRASVLSLKDQLKTHNLAVGDYGSAIADTGDRHTLKIGSKLPQNKLSASVTKPENIRASPVSHPNSDNDGPTTKVTRKPSKQQKPVQLELKNKTEAPTQPKSPDTSPTPDVNSKRGERDILDQNHKSMSSSRGQTTALNDESSHSKQADNGQSTGQGSVPQQRPQVGDQSSLSSQKVKVKKEPPYQIKDQPAMLSAHSQPVLYPVGGESYTETNSQQVPTTPKSYLDDPHKKSYYWTSERAGVYLDDFNNMPPHLRPLTIGELAQHHGIFPLGTNQPAQASLMDVHNFGHHHPQSILEDFGLSLESGLDENYSNLPQSQHRDPAGMSLQMVPSFNDPRGQFKIDDELKRKIAIKAIEAATRDPELSANLFGNFMNLNYDSEESRQNSMDNPSGSTSHLIDHNLKTILNHGGEPFRNTPTNFNSIMQPLSQTHQVSSSPPSAMTSANNQFNHLGTPIPMAAIQDYRLANNPNFVPNSTSAQPVNLVITDLANRWALSRMPDLVPIPLAATVPGYLIRLPNGKILAAALTNMFSIQGIQRGPLTMNYKTQINNKIKSLIRQPSQADRPSSPYGDVVADSGLRPTVVLPAGHYPFNINMVPATTKSSHKNNRHQHREKGAAGGLFSRGVLSQLGLGGLKTSQREPNRLLKHPNGKSKGTHAKTGKTSHNKSRIVNLTSSPLPVPSLIDQDLVNLPIAHPNEPVFSFTDESQLVDQLTDYKQASSHTMAHRGHGLSIMTPNPNEHRRNPSAAHTGLMDGGSGSNFPHLRDKLNHILDSSRTMAHLSSIGGLGGDEFFNYNLRKRKSLPRFPLKLETIYRWIASKRAKVSQKDSRRCTDKI